MKKKIFLMLFIFLAIGLAGCEAKNMDESGTTQQHFEGVKYTTVTRGYDWGPAIDKLILDFGTAIDENTLNNDVFEVKSIRTYAENSFMGSSTKEKDHEAKRQITNVYLCDARGDKTDDGEYVAIKMKVGPNVIEGSPYNYNFSNGFNENVKTTYVISLSEGAELKAQNGDVIVFDAAGEAEKAGDIKIGADDFINNQPFSYNGVDLQYAYYVPENAIYDEGSMPLIIWLHGAGEGGHDTTIALLGNKVVNLASENIQSCFGDSGAYVLVPQAPTMWMDYDGTRRYNSGVKDSDGASYYTESLMELIKNFVESNTNIDKNRIYIGGCSNGGYMTVNMIINYPDYFAAAFPACEAYSLSWLTDEKINAIKEVPIWFTHAMTDSTVPIAEGSPSADYSTYNFKLDENGNPKLIDDFSNALYDRLVELGAANIHYSRFDKVIDTTGLYNKNDGTPYEYMGHWSWIYTLNNECIENINGEDVTIFEWLSQISKGEANDN